MGNLSFNLENKVFVVTGASRGIGLEIAKMLLGQKAKVVICGRKQEGLDAAADQLNVDDQLKTVKAHIAKNEDVDRLFHIVVGTCIQTIDDVEESLVGRDQNEINVLGQVMIAHPLAQLCTIHHRHLPIADNEIGRI